MANSDMCLEAAQKAFPNDEKMRVAYMLGFNEGYDRANEQLSLPSNLDEAAQKVEDYYDVGEEHGRLCCHRGDIKDAFKAGAEWMAGQGYTREGVARPDDCEIWVNMTNTDIKDGDKVKVIILKAEDEK